MEDLYLNNMITELIVDSNYFFKVNSFKNDIILLDIRRE